MYFNSITQRDYKFLSLLPKLFDSLLHLPVPPLRVRRLLVVVGVVDRPRLLPLEVFVGGVLRVGWGGPIRKVLNLYRE